MSRPNIPAGCRFKCFLKGKLRTMISAGLYFKKCHKRPSYWQIKCFEEGTTDAATWRVPEDMVRTLEWDAVLPLDAINEYERRILVVKRGKVDAAMKNVKQSEESGVANLPLNAPIKVEFRSGWRPAFYRGIVKGSGKVRFAMDAFSTRTRTTWPEYVKPAN